MWSLIYDLKTYQGIFDMEFDLSGYCWRLKLSGLALLFGDWEKHNILNLLRRNWVNTFFPFISPVSFSSHLNSFSDVLLSRTTKKERCHLEKARYLMINQLINNWCSLKTPKGQELTLGNPNIFTQPTEWSNIKFYIYIYIYIYI